jgi:type IV secretion system protein VirD4
VRWHAQPVGDPLENLQCGYPVAAAHDRADLALAETARDTYAGLHPGRGHATVLELFWHWSRFASWRLSGKTRPSLTAWRRWRDPDAHSVFAGRAHYRHGVRVPVEEHVLVMSPPRKGKTAWLAFALMRYPGPAVCTSVKDDLFNLTSGIRATGGPVHVFNPEGYGGWPSTLAWNPVAGCQSEQVAFRRAEALTHAVSVQGTDDGSFWQAVCHER